MAPPPPLAPFPHPLPPLQLNPPLSTPPPPSRGGRSLAPQVLPSFPSPSWRPEYSPADKCCAPAGRGERGGAECRLPGHRGGQGGLRRGEGRGGVRGSGLWNACRCSYACVPGIPYSFSSIIIPPTTPAPSPHPLALTLHLSQHSWAVPPQQCSQHGLGCMAVPAVCVPLPAGGGRREEQRVGAVGKCLGVNCERNTISTSTPVQPLTYLNINHLLAPLPIPVTPLGEIPLPPHLQ